MEKVHRYNSEKTFIQAVVTSIHSRLLKKQSERKVFRLALSGGSTPGPVYEALAALRDIDWSLVELYVVDERYVPLDHSNSNYHLLYETFVGHLSHPPKSFTFFNTTHSIPECLEQYEDKLDKNDSSFFDLVILGLGTDGHTASLFPGSSALKEEKHWVAHSTTEENIVKDRLTLTYPALESSAEIFFLLRGQSKQEILEKVLSAKPSDSKLPAARLFHLDISQVFFLEE